MGSCLSANRDDDSRREPLLSSNRKAGTTNSAQAAKNSRWLASYNERKDAEQSTTLTQQINVLMDKSITKLPVAIDFPRLVLNMYLASSLDGSNELARAQAIGVRDVSEGDSEAVHVQREVLARLTEAFSGSVAKADEVREKYFDYVSPVASVGSTFNQFALEVLGENSPTIQILKCCNQGALAPAAVALKQGVGAKIPYKDVRGEWRIYFATHANGVQVVHRKREESTDRDPLQWFGFTWELLVEFERIAGAVPTSPPFRCTRTELSVVRVEFGEATTLLRRQQVDEAVKPFLKKYTQAMPSLTADGVPIYLAGPPTSCVAPT